jgi:hypothetical protein
MFASVTRLRVRSIKYLPAFLWYTSFSRRQVTRAAGFFAGRLLVDPHWTFWTLTVWESERAMKAYRGSGAHGKVMPRLAEWCDEGAYAHWELTDVSIPSWPEAYDYMVAKGRLSPVAHPSADHSARRFPRPRLSPLTGGDLKPAVRKSTGGTASLVP